MTHFLLFHALSDYTSQTQGTLGNGDANSARDSSPSIPGLKYPLYAFQTVASNLTTQEHNHIISGKNLNPL